MKTIQLRAEGPVGFIILSRGEHNAWTGMMHTEYRRALAALDDDDAVRVIVVTGRGRRFCVGADTRALKGHAAHGRYDSGVDEASIALPGYGVSRHFDANFAYHFGLTKPVVAAINGAAAGVGLVLACYSDLRFMAESAVITTAHGKLNLPAEYGLSWVLPRIVGTGRALEMLLSSRRYTAREAERIGLANRVVPDEELIPQVLAYAKDLAATVSPGSMAATKQQVYLDLHRTVGEAVADADDRLAEMVRHPDYAEGVRALVQRRLPIWGAKRQLKPHL